MTNDDAPWLNGENASAQRMVRTQLEGRDIRDRRVLEVMARLSRHRFLGGGSRAEAYGDHPVPIGHGQTISQPYIVAIMTQELALGGWESVLEVGTGSGYQTAVLACLCREVCTVERIEALHARSRVLLEDLGFRNIRFRLGDGCAGWPERAPFDRILVSAAAREIPPPLTEQLADNGVLVAPVGESDGYQRLVTVRREGSRLTSTWGIGCRFVPLVAG